MRNKKFTIEDIEKCLEELGFEWAGRYMYDTRKKQYKHAKLSQFNGTPIFLYIKRKHYMLARVSISNDEFIISHEISKLDASLLWKDILEEKTQKINL